MSQPEKLISRDLFDQLARDKKFSDGPFIDGFGDGPGEPYIPPRERDVFGTLKTGCRVRAFGGQKAERHRIEELENVIRELKNNGKIEWHLIKAILWDMKEHLDRPERLLATVWYEVDCDCGQTFRWYGGQTVDYSFFDPEALRCCHCGKVHWAGPRDERPADLSDDSTDHWIQDTKPSVHQLEQRIKELETR